jgi:hypothetical protein
MAQEPAKRAESFERVAGAERGGQSKCQTKSLAGR